MVLTSKLTFAAALSALVSTVAAQQQTFQIFQPGPNWWWGKLSFPRIVRLAELTDTSSCRVRKRYVLGLQRLARPTVHGLVSLTHGLVRRRGNETNVLLPLQHHEQCK